MKNILKLSKQFSSINNNSKGIFQGSIDLFNNIHINPEEIDSLSAQDFQQKLQRSFEQYEKDGKLAVWIKLEAQNFQHAGILNENGMEVHHGNKGYITFFKWLDKNMECKIPDYCSHYIGCGAAIINQNEEILLVQESFGGRKGLWGIPGGLCDNNELIHEAAVRELYEETGLVGEYSDLLYMREVLPSKFNRPDIYYGFLVQLNNQDQKIQLDSEELSAYQWLKVDDIPEFLENDAINPTQDDLLRQVYRLKQQGYRFYKDQLYNQVLGELNLRNRFHKYNLYNPVFKKQ